jgi:hypothetical protein
VPIHAVAAGDAGACLVDERLPLVLEGLRSGQIDPQAVRREGRLHFYGW